MLRFQPILPMRAVLVAIVAAALGLLALANVSTSAPSIARADKAQLVHAPLRATVVQYPLAIAGE
jgi:hypothetical protein